MSTVFSLIIEGKLPSTKLFENERILAIRDIHPIAPVHVLIIVKKEIPCLQDLAQEDRMLIGEVVTVAQQLAEQLGVADNYRLLTNNGPDAGQTIFHLHFHLIGGRVLGSMA
jgi:histidine triad (HIT) family protein